jgi:hypothetical protein
LKKLHFWGRTPYCKIFSPNQFAAPAACAQAYLNGAINVHLPCHNQWIAAYSRDDEMRAILGFVQNPGTITNAALVASGINFNFRNALRQSHIALENGILIYREPIVCSESYACLQLVPSEFHNILFVTFHSNPIGAHFSIYHTLHRLRLRFYWPGMYKFKARMCNACPGCTLSNPTRSQSSKLLYNFPIEAQMKGIHIDGYTAGKQQGFECSNIYLIACCGMCTFAAVEPVTNASAKSFPSAIMKIMLQYGIYHTVVLDKDSKFLGVCRESLDLLHIDCHILSGGNHNPMLVEQVNCYLNKGLKIMTNECNSIRVAFKAILLLIYAWNSCPVPGTDISRSLVTVGREFQFPINFSSGKAAALTSAPGTFESYSCLLFKRLSACHKVALLLVCEQCCWHRELVNSQRRDPCPYNIGNIVFARQATHLDTKRGVVNKLMYAFTGPWCVTASLPGASYELQHIHSPTRRNKKHALDLSLYPVELIPFQPLNGTDTCYGQLYKPIGLSPFKEAGLKGFQPSSPFKVPSHLLQAGYLNEFHWPTLSELNNNILPFSWSNKGERRLIMDGNHPTVEPILYNGPTPSPAINAPPTIPPISSLVTSILSSSDKLFFISHSLGSPNIREWHLVQVAFQDSTSLSPSCLQDGRFIVEFNTLHHNGV